MGLTGVLYGMSTSIVVAILLVTASGFFNAPSSISRRVLLQRATPRELRGRVFSAFAVVRDVTFLIGISLAGLADVVPIRILVIASSIVLVLVGLWTGIVPGIGRPAAEWRRAMSALRSASAAPAAPIRIRPATLADFDGLAGYLPALARLDAQQRAALVGAATIRDVPAGATIVGGVLHPFRPSRGRDARGGRRLPIAVVDASRRLLR
jgi:hypothetical protein